MVIFASPDDRVWGTDSGFMKHGGGHGAGGSFMTFPVWTLQDLLTARPLMETQIEEEEVKARFYKFGGVPRDVFASAEVFAVANENLNEALRSIKAKDMAKIVYGPSSAETFRPGDKDNPSSILLKLTKDNEVRPASQFVATQMVQRFFVVDKWNECLESQDKPHAYESFVLDYIRWIGRATPIINAVSFSSAEFPRDFDENGFADKYNGDVALEELLCTYNEKSSVKTKIATALVKGDAKVLYYSADGNHHLFDMGFRHGNVFVLIQCTVGRSHTCQRQLIQELYSMLGLDKAETKMRAVLLYAVPHARGFTNYRNFHLTNYGSGVEHAKIQTDLADTFPNLQIGKIEIRGGNLPLSDADDDFVRRSE